MSLKTLTARYLLDASGMSRGRAKAAAELDGLSGDAAKMANKVDHHAGAAAGSMGKVSKSATHVGDEFERTTSRMGSSLQRAGAGLGNWGVPLSQSVTRVGHDLDKAKSHATGYGQAVGDMGGTILKVGAGAFAVVGAASVKMAGDFQQQMSKMVTSGGESGRALKMVSDAVLALAGSTGTSTEQLTGGLYKIESAGCHGRNALNVLKAAAQGAKTENADLTTVADGLTTALNSYRLPASAAADVTSKMVEATAHGKTTFADLSGSLHTILPAAKAAGLSMNEVLGAMSTMTAEGTPAAVSATYLRQTILMLSAPSKKAADEMRGLGINVFDLTSKVGERGLTGSFKVMTDQIAAHMGPAGAVMVDSLKQGAAAGSKWQESLDKASPAEKSQIEHIAALGVAAKNATTGISGHTAAQVQAKQAVLDYNKALAEQPPQLARLAREIVNGTDGTKAFAKSMDALPPGMQATVRALGEQGRAARATNANVATLNKTVAGSPSAHKQFADAMAQLPPQARKVVEGLIASKQGYQDLNSVIAKLPPAQQTAIQSLATMVGGTKSMQAALELTGPSADVFKDNVKAISGATVDAKGNVQGWATVQKNFNQHLAEAKGTVEALGIRLGTALIPKVEAVAMALKDGVKWLQEHKTMATALGVVLGGVVAVAIGTFVIMTGVKMVKAVGDATRAVSGLVRGVGKMATTLAENSATNARWAGRAASSFGDVSKSSGKWVATQAGHLATGAKDMAISAGRFVAVTAVKVAGYVATAAAATAAFIAENLATLGIIAAIALLVVAVVYVATHWKQVWGGIKAVAEDVARFLSAVWHGVEKVTKAVWGAITGFLKGVWTGIKTFFINVNPAIFILKHWNQILGDAKAVWHKITGFLGDAWHGLVKSVEGAVSGIVHFWLDMPKRILGAIGNVGELLLNVGKDIVMGLVNGLESAWHWVTDKVSSLVNLIPGPIKSILGIGSPSKVMADLAVAIPQGLAVGIDNGAHLPRDAVAAMTKSMAAAAGYDGAAVTFAHPSGASMATTPYRPPMAPSVAGRGAGGGGGAGGGSVTHQTISVIVQVPGGMIGTAKDVADALAPALRPAMISLSQRLGPSGQSL